MNKLYEEFIQDAEYEKRISHTYLVYLKLNKEKNLLFPNKLEEIGIDEGLARIFRNNYKQAKIINVFDYGEGFNYKILKIPYESYNLIFIDIIFDLIFVNYFENHEEYPTDERICMHHIISELKDRCVHKFKYQDYMFSAINTYKPFTAFCDSSRKLYDVDYNLFFWEDFEAYMNSQPIKGRYRYFQLNSLIIVTEFELIAEKSWVDLLSTKIILPWMINK